jgi:hypothetical protein
VERTPTVDAVESPSPADLPSVEELAAAMSEGVLSQLRGVAKAIYGAGRFVGVEAGAAVFALANTPTRERAERVRSDVEAALAARFGRPIRLRLVDEQSVVGVAAQAPPAPAGPTSGSSAVEPATTAVEADDDEIVDVSELTEATDVVTGVDRLTEAFPGATLVEEEP